MKPIYVVYENDIGTNKHDQRLVTKAIYFAIFPLTNWKVETDSAWRTELKRSRMLLITSILLSLFVFCAPKTLLVETEGEGMAENENLDEKKTEKNDNLNEGSENRYKSDGEKSAKDYKQNPPNM